MFDVFFVILLVGLGLMFAAARAWLWNQTGKGEPSPVLSAAPTVAKVGAIITAVGVIGLAANAIL